MSCIKHACIIRQVEWVPSRPVPTQISSGRFWHDFSRSRPKIRLRHAGSIRTGQNGRAMVTPRHTA